MPWFYGWNAAGVGMLFQAITFAHIFDVIGGCVLTREIFLGMIAIAGIAIAPPREAGASRAPLMPAG